MNSAISPDSIMPRRDNPYKLAASRAPGDRASGLLAKRLIINEVEHGRFTPVRFATRGDRASAVTTGAGGTGPSRNTCRTAAGNDVSDAPIFALLSLPPA